MLGKELVKSSPDREPAKHIVIGGVSYCGSTIMNFCLGSLPGVKGASETGITIPYPGTVIPDFEFETVEQLERGACVQCGVNCDYFTKDFRERLQRDPTNWAEKFAKTLSAKTLVTSEKTTKNIEAIYPERNHDLLIMFRHPFEHWSSFEKRPWRDISAEKFYRIWINNYKKLIAYPNRGRKILLDFGEFEKSPDNIILLLCEYFGLEYSEEFRQYWDKEHHYINGNFSIRDRQRRAPESLTIKTRTSDFRVSRVHDHSFPLAIQALELYDHLCSLSSFDEWQTGQKEV